MTSSEPAAELPVPPKSSVRPRSGSYAFLVALGILLSRVAGLIRERVFAHYFGNSPAAGAFKAALRIPNLLQNLLGEGVLSAAFIPVYARLLAEDKKEVAGRVAGIVATFLTLIVSVAVLAGVLLTPFLIDLVAPGFEGDVRLLTIRLVRILFPATGLLVLAAWCIGVLNSHRKFFLAYIAPVLWSGAMIATMVLFGSRYDQTNLAVALAWGTVVGSALQFGIQLPFVLKFAPRLRFSFDAALEPVRVVFRNMIPVAMSRGVVQLSGYIDVLIASYLGTLAVASISYAQTIYMLPISLFGMSVAIAELPQLSSATGSAEEIHAAMRQRMASGLRQIAFFVIPSVIAFVAIGDLLIAALLETGDFGPDDTRLVWLILLGSTVGLLAATLGRLYNSGFYALRDTRTPLKFAVLHVVLSASLGYLFAFPMRPAIVWFFGTLLKMRLPALEGSHLALGAVGLTAGAGLAAWVEFVLLRRAINRRIGPTGLSLPFQLRLWAAAAVAGATSRFLTLFLADRLLPETGGSLQRLLIAFIAAGVFGLLYFALTMMSGVEEARRTLRRFVRR
jgi:putative peptidoglycan lipid II flippase